LTRNCDGNWHFFASLFSPALGVQGTPKRSDTQRPTDAKPCGKVNIASNLDTSTAIAAAADGTVTMNVQNCASIFPDLPSIGVTY
jgi:hypothetical protein